MNPVLKMDVESVIAENRDLSALMDSTIAITGATGFVGSFLVHVLAGYAMKHNRKIKILAMVRNEKRARELFGMYEEAGLLSYSVGDIAAPCQYEGKLDYIIHCASNAGPKEYGADPVGTMMTNFKGTDEMMKLALKCQVKKILYASTIEVYGQTSGTEAIGEHDFGYIDATVARSCYPESKKACETLSVSYYHQYRLPVVIGRLSYLYGPGMKQNDSKIAAQFPRLVAAGENIVMKSRGEQLRSYTYISDAASAMLTLLNRGEAGEAYNIATEISRITIADLAHTLCELRPASGSKVVFDLPDEEEKKRFSFINDAVLNSEKIEGLGFCAHVSISEGLERVLKSLEYER